MYLTRIIHMLMIISLKIMTNSATNECNSPECLEQVKLIKDSIDEDIDPCDDFVQFACGKHLEKYFKMQSSIVPTTVQPSTYTYHLWWVRKFLQNELNAPGHFDDPRSIRLARTFWKKCQKTTALDALASIRSLFKSLGGWPVITVSWNEDAFSWDKFSKCSRHFGFFPRMFIHVGLDIDDIKKSWRNNDTIKLTIERPTTIKTEPFEDDHSMNNLAFFTIANYLVEGKIPKIYEIDQAVQFSHELEKLRCDVNSSVPPIQEMTIELLQKKYPIINWMDYLRSMLAHRQSKYLSEYNCVTVDVCYLSAMEKLLSRTDKSIQANYAFMSITSDLFTVIRPELSLLFTTRVKDIAEICFDSTSAIFGRALDILIAKSPDEKLRNKTIELQNNIHKLTLEMIHKTPWMDLETLREAYMKLEKVSFKSPVADDIINEKYFNRMDLRQQDELSEMFRQVNNFLIDSYYLQAGRPRRKYGIYQKHDGTMAAIFQGIASSNEVMIKPERFSNTIYIPEAAIIYPKLNTIEELNFLNYATIGIQMAAALSYLVYEKGAHIDSNGQWHRDSWWSKTTQEQFMSRQSCQAIGPMKPIAEASTIFGLIGAMEIAYSAVFSDCMTKSCDQTLAGLNYTRRQLFWISSVASDCDRNLKLRYNTMVSHNTNFTEDFNCNVQTKMHVTDKCKMWI